MDTQFLFGRMMKKFEKWINGDNLYNIMNLIKALELLS